MNTLIKLCMIFPGRVGTGQGVGRKTFMGVRNCSVEAGHFYERKMKIYRNLWQLPVIEYSDKVMHDFPWRVGTGQGAGKKTMMGVRCCSVEVGHFYERKMKI